MPYARSAAAAALCALLAPLAAHAVVVTTTAAHDNTLFQDPSELSNGAGPKMYAGENSFWGIRRGVFPFDLSSIPAGAVVNSASVALHVSRATTGSPSFELHRLTSPWGEAGSNAGDPGGGGTS